MSKIFCVPQSTITSWFTLMWLWPGQRLLTPTPAYQSPPFLAAPQTVLIMWPELKVREGTNSFRLKLQLRFFLINIITTADAKSESEASFKRRGLFFSVFIIRREKTNLYFKKWAHLVVYWLRGSRVLSQQLLSCSIQQSLTIMRICAVIISLLDGVSGESLCTCGIQD